ncbi:uncharacterized protein MYCFIDRAFT_172621 [Pseudocercospora fijiensis CIRAD86]|uniref:FAD-binding domain-containing protein n=1 Tax=Pseudocercospora fijiensis (strain CIRAD86) TaxID=383855 RepID=M3BCN9_PSEFD|nr:uncharacterized protein MYCFIDRAFT_172621 [Pseudocercospora fijiensis CIRAD86]EME86933.1 hypothetical protein MYCFIDRAFT_172621 [Pseudocercospora fijiensis CIRAD86]
MTSLTISIIGAGISGLATALSISKSKTSPSSPTHKITIYESQPQLSELGARIQLSSNATRVLHNLGLGEKIPKKSPVNPKSWLLIGEIAQNPLSEWEYGFPAWTGSRRVWRWCWGGGECISENEGFKARPFKEKMEIDVETKELMELDSLNMVWCGPGLCMLGYPVAADRLTRMRLGSEVSLEMKLWDLVEECNKWTSGDLPALPTFVSASGKLVLVSDCAHAILPHSGQGGAQALEDAAALAVFVGSVKDKSELQPKMRQWSDLRQARINGVRRFAMGNQKFLTMADGPDQQKRDQMWAAMTAGWKKELERNGEEGIRAKAKATKPDPQSEDMRSPETRMYLYGYDAAEEARKIIAAAASQGMDEVIHRSLLACTHPNKPLPLHNAVQDSRVIWSKISRKVLPLGLARTAMGCMPEDDVY